MPPTKEKQQSCQGIFLNGQPLNLEDSIDFQVINETFELHYIYHPPAVVKLKKRTSVRSSPVRVIPVEQFLKERRKQRNE